VALPCYWKHSTNIAISIVPSYHLYRYCVHNPSCAGAKKHIVMSTAKALGESLQVHIVCNLLSL